MDFINSRLAAITCIIVLISSCQQPEKKEPPKDTRPNILLIVADDLGFSDIAPFGGNIHTPVLDSLAKDGLLFSDFHVLPTCSPTRSALLTGNDNHVAGLGIMEEVDYPALHEKNLPGYSGHLSDQVATIPELLKEQGYHTYMTGKWHLGEQPGGDPYYRGFEETFILGTGGGSHWNDKKPLAPPQHMDYTRNGKDAPLPADFYSSRNYTDSMISFIAANKNDNKPFFAYLAYTAVHDPLHVPKEYIDKYKGKFDMGWDSLWMLRLNNLKSLGIVPSDLKAVQNPGIPKWSALSNEQKSAFARDMEVYAGMLEYMDMSIGRIFDFLKKEGVYDNTLIIFMSDNGANGAMATGYPGNEDHKYLNTFNNKNDNRGLINSYVEQGPAWAQASTSPFRFFKSFATEGGIKAPLIVKMPGGTKNSGQWNSGFVHVTDIMPTILQLTNTPYPSQFKGKNLHPLIGKSLLPVLKGDSLTVHTNDGMGWELFEMKAYIKGDWKILRLPQPFGTGQWQLYNIKEDPTESKDVSAQHPDIKNDLVRAWTEYAKQNDVYDHRGHFDSIYRRNYSPANDDD